MEDREARKSRAESLSAPLPWGSDVTAEQAEAYERYVKQAKEEAKMGNLPRSIELFTLANGIQSSEKLKGRIKKLEEALAVFALEEEEEEEEEEFVNVLNSGLMLYKELYSKLFEHQKVGIAFLYKLYLENRKGGLLADDMGLGKTIQIIAFLSGMFDSELIKYVLLVLPTTLISNWMKEFAKWTPGMRVSEFHGTNKNERTKNLEKIQRKGGIVITTYQMLINNWQQLSSYAGRDFMWDYMVLDEAHKIKTSSAKTTKCAHNIPAKNRILLTGTPVQNNLREMWSLFDFACKGRLLGTSKTFKMEYENPITRAREKDSTPGEKALGLKISENLMNIIKPYFLRRTKEDIEKNRVSALKENCVRPSVDSRKLVTPEMPTLLRKNDLIVWVYLATVQEEIYRQFISLDQIKELLMTTKSPLAELNILKKLCDHPRLLSARACSQLHLEGHEDDEQYNDVQYAGHTGPTKIDHLSDESLIQESGKMVFLVALLERLREEGHRTLVFSQSRKMLDIINRVLTNRGFKIMRVDGTVTHIAERERRITVFQTNKAYSVFLLTTQVGGVGITLTAADRVVIFDPSWNPATDAQAVDRAYRIGQTENVIIYRLITCGTVEEKIYRRQVFKDSLIRQTTGDKKNPFRYFSKQDLKELFSLQDSRTSTTQIQLQSMHSAQRKTDTQLDEHIAYLHSLEIFGLSDHDLMYTHAAHEEHDGNEAETHYIQQRVQKAQELVQLESNLQGQIQNGTEETLLNQPVASSRPKKKETPSAKLNNAKPDFSLPKTVDLTLDDSVVEMSCQMTSLLIEDSDEEMLEQNVSDVSMAKESQIEKLKEFPNSNALPPSAASSFSDCHTSEATAQLVSNKDNSSTSKTRALSGTSFENSILCIERDAEMVSPVRASREFAPPEHIPIATNAHTDHTGQHMVTSLLLAMPNTSGASSSINAYEDTASRSITNKRLSGGSFKSHVEVPTLHNPFGTTISNPVYGDHASRLSSPQYLPEGMSTSPGECKPSNEASLEDDSLAFKSPFQSDFNLLLEDSVESEQAAMESSCQYLDQNSDLLLLIESSLEVSANNSFLGENGDRNSDHTGMPIGQIPVDCNVKTERQDNGQRDSNTKPIGVEQSPVDCGDMDSEENGQSNTNTIDVCVNKQSSVDYKGKTESEEESDTEDMFFSTKRRVQRIFSESEDENHLVLDSLDNVAKRKHVNDKKRRVQKMDSESENENDSVCALIDNVDEKAISPFNSPLRSSLKGIHASTPKQERSVLELLFPPRRSIGANVSTASRRSLVHVAVEDLDDLDETVAGNEEQHDEMEETDSVAEEECKEDSFQPKEEPDIETVPLVDGESSHLDDECDSIVLNSSSEQDVESYAPVESAEKNTPDELNEEGAQDESTGDGELLSGEQMDCFTQEKGVCQVETIQKNSLNNITSTYDALVQQGKELRDIGKCKESLNCLLKALDIKSGDPEVMLLTLGLYRQLSQC